MRKILTLGAALAVAAVASTALAARRRRCRSRPRRSGPVFIAAQTVTATGAMQNQFAPGSTVLFRAYAVDGKTKKCSPAEGRQVLLRHDPEPAERQADLSTRRLPARAGGWRGSGSWTVPADLPGGPRQLQGAHQDGGKRTGSVRADAGRDLAADDRREPAAAARRRAGATAAVARPPTLPSRSTWTASTAPQPVGAPKRAVGCSQTNVYKRGEQVVVRVWGFDLTTGATLSTDNVDTAHLSRSPASRPRRSPTAPTVPSATRCSSGRRRGSSPPRSRSAT